MDKNTLPAALAKLNSNYCNYNQTERADQVRLASGGHPAAAVYLKMRAFFDRLKYACNSSTRLVAAATGEDGTFSQRVEFLAPNLTLPRGIGGEVNGVYFGVLYPAHARWPEYIEAHVAAGFPGVPSKIDGGKFRILSATRADGAEIYAALLRLQEQHPCLEVDLLVSDGVSVGFRHNPTIEAFDAVVCLLKKRHSDSWLPERSGDDNARDHGELPMAQRRIMLGNVEWVTDNGRIILIPLIRVGEGGQTNAEVILQGLTEKLEQGLPFAEAAPHLEKILTRGAFNKLKKRFPA